MTLLTLHALLCSHFRLIIKYGGKGWTAKEIGKRLGLDHKDVVGLASRALEKLRKAASSGSEEDNDAFVEVSL